MDVTITTVIRLYEQELSIKKICKRTNLAHGKVVKILVTYGYYETEENKLFKQGYTVEEICEKLGKSRNTVTTRLPYSKGIYRAEYPTINALRIRKCRENKAE